MMSIKEIMTDNLTTVNPNTIVTQVSKLFEQNTFHHIPVVNDENICVGIISKSDYFQIQDQMTKMNQEKADKSNQLLWRSLLAEDIMTSPIISLDIGEELESAVDIFLENRVHSLVITEDGKCKGIVTTFDLIKTLK